MCIPARLGDTVRVFGFVSLCLCVPGVCVSAVVWFMVACAARVVCSLRNQLPLGCHKAHTPWPPLCEAPSNARLHTASLSPIELIGHGGAVRAAAAVPRLAHRPFLGNRPRGHWAGPPAACARARWRVGGVPVACLGAPVCFFPCRSATLGLPLRRADKPATSNPPWGHTPCGRYGRACNWPRLVPWVCASVPMWFSVACALHLGCTWHLVRIGRPQPNPPAGEAPRGLLQGRQLAQWCSLHVCECSCMVVGCVHCPCGLFVA